jgi:hypothetical protein
MRVIGLGVLGLVGAGCVVVPGGHGRHRGAVVVAPAPIIIAARPRMVFVTEFGVSFAPELEFELFEFEGVWYTYREDRWFRARAYDGPWVVVEHRHLPPGLRKLRPGQVREYYREHGEDRERGNGHGRGKKDD